MSSDDDCMVLETDKVPAKSRVSQRRRSGALQAIVVISDEEADEVTRTSVKLTSDRSQTDNEFVATLPLRISAIRWGRESRHGASSTQAQLNYLITRFVGTRFLYARLRRPMRLVSRPHQAIRRQRQRW